jgi:signal transduction histidine kinase
LRTNTQPPPVVIEQVFVDNEPVTAIDKMRLPPGKAKFEFRYAGLSYLAPEKVRFKYRLEGFDKDWVDAGQRREAFYTNIGPGSYRFRVMASNNDGVWNETGAAIEFYLAPRFYQTYWFYALGLGMALLFVFVLHRYRVRQVEAKFDAVLAERNRIAREIHDTLAQGFVGISAQLETAARLFSASPQKAIRHLDQARILVRSSLAEARRSVLDLRSQALESGDLVAALSGVARNLAAHTPIEVRVKGNPRRLAADLENNMFRIGQEALANAVKHAEARHVCLAIEFNDESILLRVQDDGRGFAAESVLASGGGHLGLVGMRERAEQMGGKLTVCSSPGAGTEIVVEAAAAG